MPKQQKTYATGQPRVCMGGSSTGLPEMPPSTGRFRKAPGTPDRSRVHPVHSAKQLRPEKGSLEMISQVPCLSGVVSVFMTPPSPISMGSLTPTVVIWEPLAKAVLQPADKNSL